VLLQLWLANPTGRLHALELKRQGEDNNKEQEAFAAWCAEQSRGMARFKLDRTTV